MPNTPKFSRKTAIFAAAILLISCAVFFATDRSYQLSFKAKFYYETGDYKNSLETSKQALQIDNYNKMAQTLLNKSQIAINLSGYIASGQEYLEKFAQMSARGISNTDRERIRLMCDIMIQGFSGLPNSPLADQGLKNEAQKLYEKFIELERELF